MEIGIKGHLIRNDEVVKILEMLGGKNHYKIVGGLENHFYYIGDKDKYITNSYIGPDEIKGYEIFSLEDFLEKFPYKVGDKVNAWVFDDYYLGRTELVTSEIKSMRWNSTRCEIAYRLKDICKEFYKSDIKGKVNDDENVDKAFQGGYEKCKSEMNMNDNNVDLTLKISTCYVLPDGYHFADENGNVIDVKKIHLVKNSPTYPKTYAECCRVIGYGGIIGFTGLADEEEDLYAKFIALKRCRDAYWKIAGEELGLDKPWEPDWNWRECKFCIGTIYDKIEKFHAGSQNCILSFPTEEMQNAFYENFKDLIEQCKELL